MSPLIAIRLGMLAWSWRRPLVLASAAAFCLPLALATVLVMALSPQQQTGLLAEPLHGFTITQPFGCTSYEREPWSAGCPQHHFHSGLDLAAPLDTAVWAATSGLAQLGEDPAGYGHYLVIVRDPHFSTLYGHLDRALVRAGEMVSGGQRIALLGSSGNSTGPHLHFEVRIDGKPVDPAPFLKADGKDGGA
jgi:murein DD-endopeptidase MepM/ murein hydrolase activator NlpD